MRLCSALFALLFAYAGSALAFPVERCINLSNFLEVPKEEDWAYDHKPEHINAIAAAGFDTLRLPINAADYWDGIGLQPDFMERVQSTVSRARDAGLFVIVDLHHFKAFNADPGGNRDDFLGIWKALAAHFKGQSGLAFELVNEPTNAKPLEEFLPIYDAALAVIRADHPKAWVILGGVHWNNLFKMLELPAPSDPWVVHTFHYYVPFEFTHQQAPWADDPLPPQSWGTDKEKQTVTDHMAVAASHGTTAFLGEFGAIDTAPAADRLAWIRHVRTEAEKVGLPWCHWGFGARFGVFDPVEDDWRADVLDALID